MTYIYTVTVKPMSNAFVSLNRFDPDAIIELTGHDKHGNEIYKIETEHDIDRILDLSDTVIIYETEEV